MKTLLTFIDKEIYDIIPGEQRILEVLQAEDFFLCFFGILILIAWKLRRDKKEFDIKDKPFPYKKWASRNLDDFLFDLLGGYGFMFIVVMGSHVTRYFFGTDIEWDASMAILSGLVGAILIDNLLKEKNKKNGTE